MSKSCASSFVLFIIQYSLLTGGHLSSGDALDQVLDGHVPHGEPDVQRLGGHVRRQRGVRAAEQRRVRAQGLRRHHVQAGSVDRPRLKRIQ